MRAMASCFVSRALPGPALDRLRAVHEVDLWPEPRPPTRDELIEHTAPVEGLLSLLHDPIDRDFLAACPKLRAISNYAVGYDNVDLEAASERGIPVGHTPDVLTDATADFAFTLLLASARRLAEGIAVAARGDWPPWGPGDHLGHEVHGSTLGIIGYGRIGRAVAKRAEGFDMQVLHTSSSSDADLEPLLRQSDFVSLHCPLTPETYHLIDTKALALMRRGAILINTTRGPVVDQVALRDALVDGTIAGAALDVTDPEPLPAGDPLLGAPNLIVTPHIASATRVARERMADVAVDNLLAGLERGSMPHQANVLR
jgi:glyoxylate reductase